MNPRTRTFCEILGWITFIASALCYVASGIRAGDMLSVSGSVLFFIACLIFLIPFTSFLKRAEIE